MKKSGVIEEKQTTGRRCAGCDRELVKGEAVVEVARSQVFCVKDCALPAVIDLSQPDGLRFPPQRTPHECKEPSVTVLSRANHYHCTECGRCLKNRYGELCGDTTLRGAVIGEGDEE